MKTFLDWLHKTVATYKNQNIFFNHIKASMDSYHIVENSYPSLYRNSLIRVAGVCDATATSIMNGQLILDTSSNKSHDEVSAHLYRLAIKRG